MTRKKKTDESFPSDPVAQDRDRLKRMEAVAKRARNLETQIGALKEDVKILKEQKAEADRELWNLAANVPQAELFAQAVDDGDDDD